jgi:TM2 domain-containing membrane protein YozV
MPVLKQYVETSPKDGVYVQANVGGSHPITLQVSDIAELVLRNNGYRPEAEVPGWIVWKMYEVGLLYTESDVSEVPEVNRSIEDVFRGLGVTENLSDAERDQLIEFLEQYRGPEQEQIASLLEFLRSSRSKADAETTVSVPSSNETNVAESGTGGDWAHTSIVAGVASLFVPGAGQMLNGDVAYGLKLLGAYVLWWVLSLVLTVVLVGVLMLLAIPLFHIGLAIDAFLGPRRYRE